MTVQLIGCYTEIEENKLSDKEAEKYAKVLLGVERGQTQSFSNDGQELKKANDNHWLLEWLKKNFSKAA